MEQRIIKVVVVEDSLVIRDLLVHILEADPEIRVIGTANNGEEALEVVKREKPDIITMDINMPKMNGFEATRRIMETDPVPIVIVSAKWNPEEVEKTFSAMQAGALTCLEKPFSISHPDYEKHTKKLIETVKLMSEVKVVRRWNRHRRAKTKDVNEAPSKARGKPTATDAKLVGIGASTGGPPALQTILSHLPKDFPVPLLVVQHIAVGFLEGLVGWLGSTTGWRVQIAADGEQLLPGHVYVAPDGFNMGVSRVGQIALDPCESVSNDVCPSVSYLFRSVASVLGANAIGVLLTGMGRDGAQELKLMKDKGCITIAQDQESSVVHGMPGQAIELQGATYALPPDGIAATLESLVNQRRADWQ